MLTNKHPEAWNTDYLDALHAWAMKTLSCAGRYTVIVCRNTRPIYKGHAWPWRKRVKLFCPRRLKRTLHESFMLDPRLPELHDWVRQQKEAGLCPRTGVELLVWILGHELWHCEDPFSCQQRPVWTRRRSPDKFAVMEMRCDEAGFELLRRWRAGGRAEVASKTLAQLRARRDAKRARSAATSGSTSRLGAMQAALRAARGS